MQWLGQAFVGAYIGFMFEEFFFFTPGRRLSRIGPLTGAIVAPVVFLLFS